jgi:hypothetical protein
MTYAHVDTTGAIDMVSESPPKAIASRPNGPLDVDLRSGDPELLAQWGWFEIVSTPRPADTATETYELTLIVVDGVPTETWVARPLTNEELAGGETQSNVDQLVEESNEAVDKLIAVVEKLNVLTAMSNSIINNNPAAIIKDLARECKTIARQANREARLTSGRTEDTNTGSGT